MYGAMGVKKGYLPLQQGAMTVTYKGRSSIEHISTFIPKKYNGKTVYGDTDSSMIYFAHITNNKDAVSLAEEITKEMESHFKKPMKLEFEKIYEKYLILSKKRYLAQVANKEGKIIDFVKKGVVLTRRDNCKALRDIYLKTVIDILDNVSSLIILNNIVDYINSMFQRQINYNYFVITKSLSKNINEYDKKKALPSHVQLAKRMIERGQIVDTGSRIEYIFTNIGKNDPKFNQGDKVESLEYFEKWFSYIKIDYLYYLEKQMITPIDEILTVGLKTNHFMDKLFLYHSQYSLVVQEINSIRTEYNFVHFKPNFNNSKNYTNNEWIEHLSKNNSKKLWKLEFQFITNSNKYNNQQIKLLTKIRKIKNTNEIIKEIENENSPKRKTLIQKTLEISNVLVKVDKYY